MTETPHFVFWQNTLSLHQAPLARALCESGAKVTVVTQEGVSLERQAMGWDEIDYGPAEVIAGLQPRNLQPLLDGIPSTAHHVFSGLDVYPLVAAARRRVSKIAHGHIFVATESWDPRGARGLIRSWLYGWRARRLAGVDTVLTIGTQSAHQFGQRLPRSVRRAPFGYFVDAPAPETTRERPLGDTVQLLFVGSLTSLKRVDVLLETLKAMRHRKWHLSIIGDGPLRPTMEAAAGTMADNVSFLGTLPNEAVRSIMSQVDVVVLPSQYDGWGAVVSEALMAGTPVLVSDAAGVSGVVTTPSAGTVFSAGSVRDLQDALARVMARGRVTSDQRRELSRWANSTISPHAAAMYLRDLAMSPSRDLTAPWVVPEGSRDVQRREEPGS